MMARRRRTEHKAEGFTARPRKTRTLGGVEEHYWTVRCRRKGEMGEWSLGWYASNRMAEHAFFAWIAEHRKSRVTVNGDARMRDVIAEYQSFAQGLGKRPTTIRGRTYTSSQLDAFLGQWSNDVTIGDFDDDAFGEYLTWLKAGTKLDSTGAMVPRYSPQTIENALIGARTFLRWAITQKYLVTAPKCPEFEVPEIDHAPLYAEDIEALVRAAERPLNLMLRLIWQTGLRITEATTLRPMDLDEAANFVLVRKRGDFVPKTTKSNRRVPVTPEMMAELVELAGDDPTSPLFECGVKCRYHYWRHRFNKAKKAAGLRHFTFHDLRRAVADRHRLAGTPMDRYCKYMGHSPITALRHYTVVDPDDLHHDLHAALDATRTRKGKRGRLVKDDDPEVADD